ncbi:MAG: thiol-disulfide isomerase/thioredoxin [Planctomycetota bacterium]|jgi:thiol-disulfide isomerase/thioredoxin
MHHWIVIAASLHCLIVPLGAQDTAPRFSKASLAEIRAAAEAKPTPIVIDFSTDSCEPCRRLLATTWRDAQLWRMLDQKTVVVRVDPEQEQAAAKQFALLAYPTIVVLGKDGAEVHRVVGYIDAATLREQLAQLVSSYPTNYKERQALAEAAHRKGDNEQALGHYLWLWDHGQEHNTGFGGVRVSFFLRKLTSFAKKYEPARKALEQRRDFLEKQALTGDIDYGPISDMVHLNESLDTRDRSLRVLEQVPEKAWRRESIAHRVLVQSVTNLLIKKKRYAEAVRYLGNPAKAFDKQLETLRTSPLPPAAQKQMEASLVRRQSKMLEAFFGAKDDAKVQPLVEALLELKPNATTWIMVLTAAKRAGHDVACHDYAVRALQELPEKDRGRVRRFLKRK